MRASEFISEELKSTTLTVGDRVGKDTAPLRKIVRQLIDNSVEPKVTTVDPEQLVATQNWLSTTGGFTPFPKYQDHPVILQYNNKKYILDGHHRTSKAIEKNQPIEVYLFDADLDENFDDGKNPGRKGLSRRVGIPKKATLGQLEKIAKSSTGERRRMAQWQLNMRRGRKK